MNDSFTASDALNGSFMAFGRRVLVWAGQ